MCNSRPAPEDKARPRGLRLSSYVMTKGSLAPVTNHFCPAARAQRLLQIIEYKRRRKRISKPAPINCTVLSTKRAYNVFADTAGRDKSTASFGVCAPGDDEVGGRPHERDTERFSHLQNPFVFWTFFIFVSFGFHFFSPPPKQ